MNMNKTTIKYDNRKNIIKIIYPEIDGICAEETFAYDDNNRLLSYTDLRGTLTAYSYHEDGSLKSEKVGNRNAKIYPNEKDKFSNGIKRFDHKDIIAKKISGIMCDIIKLEFENGNTTSYYYDAMKRIIRKVDSIIGVTNYTYSPAGDLLSETDALGNKKTYTYDDFGNKISFTDARGYTTSYTYDANDNLHTVTDAKGNTFIIECDDNSNITNIIDANGNTISNLKNLGKNMSYGYNELNIKEQHFYIKNENNKLFYDEIGRIVRFVTSENTVNYTYDENGNVLTVSDKNGVITRTYDELNRVSTYTDTYGKTVSYTYDSVGNLERIIYPDNTAVKYTYDKNNNLETVKDWDDRVTRYNYDNNNLSTEFKPDGSVTIYNYDDKNRIVSLKVEPWENADYNMLEYEFNYDDLGRISIEKEFGIESKIKKYFTYDEHNRVTNCKIVNATTNEIISQQRFTYDDFDNIVSDSCSNIFTYDINNRLISYNGRAITYDAIGNMVYANLSNGETHFEYDSANHLVKAGTQVYIYNGDNIKIKSISFDSNGNQYIENYTYNANSDSNQLLFKTVEDTITKYVYGLGLIGEETNGKFSTYHFDLYGNTVFIHCETLGPVAIFKYDSSGNHIQTYNYYQTNNTNEYYYYNFGHKGKDGVMTEINGLIYDQKRYYLPELKKFINNISK